MTARLLDPDFVGLLAEHVDRERAAPFSSSRLAMHPDTVYLTVVDGDLNAVSFINSLYDGFGSGLMCDRTGVLFHSRGRAFRLEEGHPNALAPRKRPMHTILPTMALKDGQPWMSFGVMGGDYQPVGQSHLITGMVDFGLDPQAALDAPRSMAYPGPVELESALLGETARQLAALGHEVVPTATGHGGGQAIMIDRARGVLIGGSDPRKDGFAMGY